MNSSLSMKTILVLCCLAGVLITLVTSAAVILQDTAEGEDGQAEVKTGVAADDQDTSEFFLHKLLYLLCGKRNHGFGGGYGGYGGYGGGLGGYGGGLGGYGGGLGGYGGGLGGYGGGLGGYGGGLGGLFGR